MPANIFALCGAARLSRCAVPTDGKQKQAKTKSSFRGACGASAALSSAGWVRKERKMQRKWHKNQNKRYDRAPRTERAVFGRKPATRVAKARNTASRRGRKAYSPLLGVVAVQRQKPRFAFRFTAISQRMRKEN